MQLYPKLILDALAKVRYPGNGKDLVANEMIEDDIRIDGNKVSFSIIFDKPTDPFIRSVVKAAETAILTFVSPEVNIKGNIAVVRTANGHVYLFSLACAVDELFACNVKINAVPVPDSAEAVHGGGECVGVFGDGNICRFVGVV